MVNRKVGALSSDEIKVPSPETNILKHFLPGAGLHPENGSPSYPGKQEQTG